MLSPNLINDFLFLLDGVNRTLIVTVTCFTSAFVIGLTIAILRRLPWPLLRWVLNTYVFIFQSIPVLIMVFLIFFGLPQSGFDISPLFALNISLGMISGSYLAEVFRGAFQSVSPHEIAAAKTAGMNDLQVVLYVELPQALRFSLPGIGNEFSTVLKASPFAYIIGVPELTKQAMSLSAITMDSLSVYASSAAIYFVIYKFFKCVTNAIERKFTMNTDGMAGKLRSEPTGFTRVC